MHSFEQVAKAACECSLCFLQTEETGKENTELKKKGLTPRQTTFQTEKQYLRDAIDTVVLQASSQEEFSRLLAEKYNITFKVSRGRYSYLHPNRQKYIT